MAEKGAVAAASATDLTRLGIAARTASAYLDAAAAHELVAVAQANVNRMQTFANSVHVLVDNNSVQALTLRRQMRNLPLQRRN